MKRVFSPGTTATTKSNFIETFAFGDKSKAIRSLIAEAHSSHRFVNIDAAEFIYEALEAGTIAEPAEPAATSKVVSA